MRFLQRTLRVITAVMIGGAGALFLSTPPAAQDTLEPASTNGRAVVLEVDGPIGPATSDFIVRGIDNAEQSGAKLVILRLDTPGGLSASMRDIIRRILASSIPVATFVAPSGARAASAGTYIMYASHIAAMAPATNLGSATPVSMAPGGIGGGDRAPGAEDDQSAPEADSDTGKEGDTGNAGSSSPKPGSAMERKAINDAVAYIKGLAELRGRNGEWAERAVREALNLTARGALEQNVIDYVARDTDDLLAQLDGVSVTLGESEVVLNTDNLTVQTVKPDWRTRILSILTNPNVAYVLMLAGVYGIFFELSSPGSLFPGVLGAICLVLAFYAFQVLPVNYAGLALILLGMAFLAGEAFVPSFGVLGIGGAVSFVIGSVILMETGAEAYQISLPVIAIVTVATVLFIVSVITLGLRQRGQPVVSGAEQMLGASGEAIEDFRQGTGYILIHGEHWSARANVPVRKGQRVTVRAMHGLNFEVEPMEAKK